MAETNGAPAIHAKKPPVIQDHPQQIVRDPFLLVPHVETFSGKYNYANKSYYVYFDEALRDSLENTLVMRRDGYVHELIRHRQLPVACLPFSVDVDDPDHPGQKSISEVLYKIVRAIPKLKTMIVSLLESIFYGKMASQLQLGPRRVAGNTWNSVVYHIPVNGDKLRYKHDGTPGLAIRPGAVSSMGDVTNAFLDAYQSDIETTQLGPALFLRRPFLRDRFVIHEFEPSDTDYLFEIDQAQSIHGLGLRSRYYWLWNLRTELLGWMITALQRVGANGMLYGFYPEGNKSSQDAVLSALRQLVQDNYGAFPYRGGTDTPKDLIQRLEPSPVGYDVLFNLITHIEGIMRRGFLGQDLSSQSKPTGIGTGATELHADVRSDYIEYDASLLAETLTEQLLSVILKYNIFKYEDKHYYGSDLPFSCRLTFQVGRDNVNEAIQAANALFQMGVDLDADDLRDKAGLSPPKKKATAVVNPQIRSAMQQFKAGVPGAEGAMGPMKGLVDGIAKKGAMAGQLPGQEGQAPALEGPASKAPAAAGGGSARFARAGDPDDCGHEPSGEFGDDNTCAAGSAGGEEAADTVAGDEEVEGKYKNPWNPWRNYEDATGGNYDEVAWKVFGGKIPHPDILVEAAGLEPILDMYPDAQVRVSVSQPNMSNLWVKVKIEDHEGITSIRAFQANAAERQAGTFHVKGNMFYIRNEKARKAGLALDSFTSLVDNAIKLGATKVNIHAAGDPFHAQKTGDDQWSGYYVWPRFGYDAHLRREDINATYEEIANVLGRTPEDIYEDGFQVSEFMETKEGRDFWKERGGEAEMEFDLTPGSKSRRILSAYRKEREFDDPEGPDRFRRSSRFARAGDADDCGHEREGGEFAEGNTCAGGGGGESGAPADGMTLDEAATMLGRLAGNARAFQHVLNTSENADDIASMVKEAAELYLGHHGGDVPEHEPFSTAEVRALLSIAEDHLDDFPITEEDPTPAGLAPGESEPDEYEQMLEAEDKPTTPVPEAPGWADRAILSSSFDRAAFDSACEETFGRRMEPWQVANLGGVGPLLEAVPGARAIVHADSDERLAVSATKMGRFTMQRYFERDRDGRPYVHNELFRIDDEDLRGTGLGQAAFSSEVEAATGMGLAYIETYAAGDYDQARRDKGSGMDWAGYYVWPRFGYERHLYLSEMNADGQEYDRVKAAVAKVTGRSVQDLVDGGFNVSELMTTPEGRDIWQRYGSRGEMKFDLTKGSTSRRILSAYRKEKGVDDPKGPDRFRRRPKSAIMGSSNQPARPGESPWPIVRNRSRKTVTETGPTPVAGTRPRHSHQKMKKLSIVPGSESPEKTRPDGRSSDLDALAAGFGLRARLAPLPGRTAARIKDGTLIVDVNKCEALTVNAAGIYSTSSYNHPAYHELGRFLCPRPDLDGARGRFQRLARHVSAYAATSPGAFIGETFALLATGGTPNAEAMELYADIGGILP